MRKIKVVSWIEKDKEGKEVETNTITLLNMLLSMKDPKDMPRGLDNFRTMNRLMKAFDKAEKNKELNLEEADYKFLKDSMSNDLPAIWGRIPEAYEAIDLFVEAKSDLSSE